MKWLEIIELRSVDRKRDQLKSILLKLIEEVDKETKRKSIRAFSRSNLDTDFSMHLFHESKKVNYNGTPLGLHLSSALKEFGFVNHTIWTELH
ncbi:MAG: hypothetical protein HOK29_13245 [Candidatus Marinimicrobia bacterium]|jgi:hypothetical protein|nr:hypothetical protein [Candidatus Neomarinimicrobiota bacterium]